MSNDVVPSWAGYLCVLIAGLCFGSNFVPVKYYSSKIGDGVFFQWIFCSAVWVAGFIVFGARSWPRFEPLAMLGGFLWCTGNIMTVPIIKCIGLSMGMLLWGTANLLMGWCSGTFGLFGLTKEEVNIPWLNYVGAVLALISATIFANIKPSEENAITVIKEDLERLNESKSNAADDIEMDFIDRLDAKKKRILGISMSIVAGLLYGTNFDPPQYLIDNCETCSQSGMDYVFSHFCGIYLTSTFYFLVYCVLMQNKPYLPSEIAFPGFISGLMWALADVSWFVANSTLKLVISFPTISILPGVVASLWGILVFHEIKGKRNFIVFGGGFMFTLMSITCTVLSKVLSP